MRPGLCKRHLNTTRAFTHAEAERLLALVYQDNAADIADLMHFLFGTGVRISEALHCTSWTDVDLEAGTVRVRGTKTVNADRTLALSDDLVQRLKDRADQYGTEGLVFGITRYATKLGEPRDAQNVLKRIRRVLNKAGLPWAGSHSFRRTVATWMDEGGVSIAEIANQLGHGDPAITLKYLGRKAVATKAASIMVLNRP